MIDAQSHSLILSGQKKALYEALFEQNQLLANIYLGTLKVLTQHENPDQLAFAAHGIRELMEKLPAYFDVQIKAQTENLKDKVRQILDSWQSAITNTKCHNNGSWKGKIDGSLIKFLKKLGEFSKWFDEYHPRRKAEIIATLRELDSSAYTLPKPLEELNIKAWDQIRDFFQLVAHHKKNTSAEEFDQWLIALERFLLDRLRPRTFVDFENIDKLIREGDDYA